MTLEHHPYQEFIPENPQGMIIGSFPIGKFTNPSRKHEIKPHELMFFFGGEKNLLWRLISHARGLEIHGVQDIINMLNEMGIGVGDVIKSCRRKNGGASDSDLFDIKYNFDLINVIRENRIKTVYFTSRKVEARFNKLFPESHDLKKVSLISPSSQTLRAIGRNPEFQKWREKNKDARAMDFVYLSYKKVFSRLNRD